MTRDMLNVGIFIFELFLLFLFSKAIHKRISHFLFAFTRSTKVTVGVIAFLFLPGTFLHEVAHWVMAKMLFVPAGKMSLKPELRENSLRLGSVSIAKTDPLRRILIGMAPVFVGLSILLIVFYFASRMGLFNSYWMILILGYVVFEVGNTMFSSKKDMEGAVGLLAIFLILGGIGYLLGLRVPAANMESFLSQELVALAFEKGVLYLLFPIGVDLIFLLILKVFHR